MNEEYEYFAYTLISCEMGSEGNSGWGGFTICKGKTVDEVIEDYIKQRGKTSREIIIDEVIDTECPNDMPNVFHVHDYFDTYFIKLQTDVYGWSKPIEINFPYSKHTNETPKTDTKENDKTRPIMLIDTEEYHKQILDYITSDKINKAFNSTVFATEPKCKQAMIHGMCIAAMLTSKCSFILGEIKHNKG